MKTPLLLIFGLYIIYPTIQAVRGLGAVYRGTIEHVTLYDGSEGQYWAIAVNAALGLCSLLVLFTVTASFFTKLNKNLKEWITAAYGSFSIGNVLYLFMVLSAGHLHLAHAIAEFALTVIGIALLAVIWFSEIHETRA